MNEQGVDPNELSERTSPNDANLLNRGLTETDFTGH